MKIEKLNEKLLEVCEEGNIKKVKSLIKRGANVNYLNPYRITALMEATRKGHKDICELLIANGADINQDSVYAWTALMYAAEYGYSDICKLLIENGADVDYLGGEDWHNTSALSLAERFGHKEICELLSRKNDAKISPILKDSTKAFGRSECHHGSQLDFAGVGKGIDDSSSENE